MIKPENIIDSSILESVESNYYTNFKRLIDFMNMKLRKLRMKRNVKVFVEILIFLMAIGLDAYSQDDYVVTLAGDTIVGFIIIHQNSNSNIDQLSLKVKEGKRRQFMATDLRSFWLDSSMFRTIKYIDRYQFMEVQMDGYLSLLKYRAKGDMSFNNQLLHKMDGAQQEVPRLGFSKIMAKFLSECPVVLKKIEEKEYKLSDLEAIIIEYNNCIDSKSRNILVPEVSENKDDIPGVTINSASEQQSNTVLTMLEDIKSRFESSNIESADFNSIYSDIRLKIISEEVIPNYLIDALRNSVSQSEEMVKMVDAIVEYLPK